MKYKKDNYFITDDKSYVNIDTVKGLLSNTYWASKRSFNTIKKSIEHSICFSLYKDDMQIGFARIVTDYSTFVYLADVIINIDYRGMGLGKWFVKKIITDKRWDGMLFMLATKDAHQLYEKFGFKKDNKLMGKK